MKTQPKGSAHLRLKEERELRGWSQQYVAEQIGADRYYLSRWEHAKVLPSPYYREKLCALFGKNAKELGFLQEEATQKSVDRENAPIYDPSIPPSPGATRSIGQGSISTPIYDPSIPPLPGTTHDLVGRQELLTTLKARLCANTPSITL